MVKKLVSEAEKEGVSVKQFADEIGVKADRLLSQFKDAGIKIANISDQVSEEQKQKLLRYLQQHHHGAKQDTAPDKIVLRRAKTSEIKLGGSHGPAKTVSIQVRKKRTYVKRPLMEEEAKPQSDEKLASGVTPELQEVIASVTLDTPAVQTDIQPPVQAAVEPVAEATPSYTEEVPDKSAEEKATKEKAKAAIKYSKENKYLPYKILFEDKILS